jgi:hypothetical protein
MVVRMLGAAAIAAVMSFNSVAAFSEEGHDLATMKGDHGIDLKAYDHAMAGSIKNFVVWGSVNEATGTSELIMRRDGQDVKSIFKKTDNVFGGTVEHQTEDGKKTTTVRFVGLDRQRNEYSFSVNGQSVKAGVVAEEFRDNHFIKPTYTITTSDGNKVSFKFDGQACYNYSLHILTMMIAAVSH